MEEIKKKCSKCGEGYEVYIKHGDSLEQQSMERVIPRPDPHGHINCLKCGTRVECINRGKNDFRNWSDSYLIQQIPDGVAIRNITTRANTSMWGKTELHFTENERMLLVKNEPSMKISDYSGDKNYWRINNRLEFPTRNAYGTEMIEKSHLKYSGYESRYTGTLTKEISSHVKSITGLDYLYAYNNMPEIEMLAKMGLDYLVDYCVENKGVCGFLNTKKKIQGYIISIKEDEKKNIDYYTILDNKTGIKHKVDPTSVKLINKETLSMPSLRDLTRENYFLSFTEFLNEKDELNFTRNQNPIKSLGLGYEESIRNFFRQYNIPDEIYNIKENSEIVFNEDLDLETTQISKLPDNLTINGWLFLKNTLINILPTNLTINGTLDLRGTQITKLPNDLIVNIIWVNKDQIELIKFIKNSKFKFDLRIDKI